MHEARGEVTLALCGILEGVPHVACTLVGAGSVGTDLGTLVSVLSTLINV